MHKAAGRFNEESLGVFLLRDQCDSVLAANGLFTLTLSDSYANSSHFFRANPQKRTSLLINVIGVFWRATDRDLIVRLKLKSEWTTTEFFQNVFTDSMTKIFVITVGYN